MSDMPRATVAFTIEVDPEDVYEGLEKDEDAVLRFIVELVNLSKSYGLNESLASFLDSIDINEWPPKAATL